MNWIPHSLLADGVAIITQPRLESLKEAWNAEHGLGERITYSRYIKSDSGALGLEQSGERIINKSSMRPGRCLHRGQRPPRNTCSVDRHLPEMLQVKGTAQFPRHSRPPEARDFLVCTAMRITHAAPSPCPSTLASLSSF